MPGQETPKGLARCQYWGVLKDTLGIGQEQRDRHRGQLRTILSITNSNPNYLQVKASAELPELLSFIIQASRIEGTCPVLKLRMIQHNRHKFAGSQPEERGSNCSSFL